MTVVSGCRLRVPLACLGSERRGHVIQHNSSQVGPGRSDRAVAAAGTAGGAGPAGVARATGRYASDLHRRRLGSRQPGAWARST